MRNGASIYDSIYHTLLIPAHKNPFIIGIDSGKKQIILMIIWTCMFVYVSGCVRMHACASDGFEIYVHIINH